MDQRELKASRLIPRAVPPPSSFLSQAMGADKLGEVFQGSPLLPRPPFNINVAYFPSYFPYLVAPFCPITEGSILDNGWEHTAYHGIAPSPLQRNQAVIELLQTTFVPIHPASMCLIDGLVTFDSINTPLIAFKLDAKASQEH